MLTRPRLFSVYFDESSEARLINVSLEIIRDVGTPVFTDGEIVTEILMSTSYLPNPHLPDGPMDDVMIANRRPGILNDV